jgi:uncharacterized protein
MSGPLPYTVHVRFYEELNDFLPRPKRRRDYPVSCPEPRSVKDLIESEGVPHPEVDLILVNGQSVPFSHPLRDGDRISVYPCFESFDIRAVSRLGRPPLRQPRFLADVHLGTLTRYLRLLGLDCASHPAWDDAQLAAVSQREHRILLTRDIGLLKRSQVTHGLFIRSDQPRHQAIQVLRRFQLRHHLQPGARCLACNGLVAPVDRQSVRDRVPPDTWAAISDYRQCADCGRVYWQGAHWQRLHALIRDFTAAAEPMADDPENSQGAGRLNGERPGET